MTHWYIKAVSSVGTGTGRAEWTPNTAYVIGDKVVCRPAYSNTARRQNVYECTTGGTSHATTEPTWPASGTVNDNGVVWTQRTPTTWANASIYLNYLGYSTVSGLWAAGDTFWVDNTSDVYFASDLYVFGDSSRHPGSLSTLTYVISTSDLVNEPPTSRAAGAKVRASGFIRTKYGTKGLHFYGMYFECGYNAVSGDQNIAHSTTATSICEPYEFENCTFKLGYASSANSRFYPSGVNNIYDPNSGRFYNCTFAFTNVGQAFTVYGHAEIYGGSVTGTPPNVLFTVMGGRYQATVDAVGMDLSLLTNTIIDNSAVESHAMNISRCKLNSGVTVMYSQPYIEFVSSRADNCSHSTPNYRIAVKMRGGDVVDETTYVRDDGATDGTTRVSWKMIGSSLCALPSRLYTPMIAFWNESVGTSKTITIEILHDSATPLKDYEIWMNALVLEDENFPIVTFKTDFVGTCFTASDQETSTAPWTTSGMGNPNRQKLSLTFTPRMKGLVVAWVGLSKANYTVYVDPLITIS